MSPMSNVQRLLFEMLKLNSIRERYRNLSTTGRWTLDIGPWTFLDRDHFQLRIDFLFQHAFDGH
jgi:hypothetical protein